MCGKQGPTGKTTLADALRALGAMVYEPHEMVTIEMNEFLEL